MITTAKITSYDGENLVVIPYEPLEREILHKHINVLELRLSDGREITPQQRRKIYATVRDIAVWSGYEPQEAKQYLKWEFCGTYNIEDFSLSNVNKTTACEFISFLIEFCLENDIPLSDTALNRTDDIGRYLYACIINRKCAVCGKHADIHHAEGYRVGMGNNRNEIYHVGREAVALCRTHHNEAHTGEQIFFDMHHIYGIKLDEYAVNKLKLGVQAKNKTVL